MLFGVTALRLENKILQVRQGVGLEVGKKNDVMFILKCVTEG